MDNVSEESVGEVDLALARIETELGEVAEVSRDSEDSGGGITMVRVDPRNANASPMSWILLGDEILFEAGRHGGGRWELAKTVDGVEYLKQLVRAVVDGRVHEAHAHNRSRLTVTLEDGTTDQSTIVRSFGAVLSIGWRRRERTVDYEPYENPAV